MRSPSPVQAGPQVTQDCSLASAPLTHSLCLPQADKPLLVLFFPQCLAFEISY